MDNVTCPFETLVLDSGFRRRDELEASSLFVIPAKAGIQLVQKKCSMSTQLWPY